MLLLAAVSPILILVFGLQVLRYPLSRAAPVSYFWTVILAVTIWQLPWMVILSATLKGLLLALDIIFIVFGAIAFISFLKHTKAIQNFEEQLLLISPDRRLQAVIISWLFGGFIEGTSGFGTPAAIVAPLLVAIGFPALLTVAIALVANSTSVIFGAVGTPIRIGFAGLDVAGVGFMAAKINFFSGLAVPLIIVAMIVNTRTQHRLRAFIECAPWAVWAGLTFNLPYLLISFFNDELPSLFGGAIGLVLMVISLRFNFLVPKKCWRFETDLADTAVPAKSRINILKAVFPYALLISILLIGRFSLSGIQFPFYLPGQVLHSLKVFNPGFAFLTALFLLSIFWKNSHAFIVPSISHSLRSLRAPFVSILFITALVQTMLLSARSESISIGMLEIIVDSFKTANLPWFAAVIGAFGSFISGSATVSNLLFGPLQLSMANELNLNHVLIMSLQLIGAGIGNMIAFSNILAAEATVNIPGHEGEILRRIFPKCLLYLLVVTVISRFF